MEFKGVITYISPVENVGAKQIPKMTIVIEEVTDREYKGSISVDVFNQKVEEDSFKNLNVGEDVIMYFNSRCREYNGKYYNSLSAWKVEVIGDARSDDSSDLPF